MHEKTLKPERTWSQIITTGIALLLLMLTVGVGFFVIQGREAIRYAAEVQSNDTTEQDLGISFPLGVDPTEKEITENPVVDVYFETHIQKENPDTLSYGGIVTKVVGKLAQMSWYQNLASVSTRLLVIQAGERKEQVAVHFGKILGWNKSERKEFLDRISSSTPEVTEGMLVPGSYTVSRDASPEEVSEILKERFTLEVLARYDTEVREKVPLKDALVIASLLEREAYDFTDMRYISGVIWNRLFDEMKLQIDATLQYAKGSKSTESWWPRVRPNDKYIASLYNTYKYEGLPPTAIANPSLDAILAALNPRKTDCMYYFHDADSQFHCSPTYEGHVALLKQYYGRGR